ncbi:MAG: M81 family metallopeptidase, partial [Acidimicrobiales bacterium]
MSSPPVTNANPDRLMPGPLRFALMRIAIGGIVHETNSYAVDSFGMTSLSSFGVRRDERILRYEGTRTFIGGMIAGARAAGHEVVPTLHAFAQPSGTIEAETYSLLRDELVERIEAALPLDAVVLDTHGAGIVEGIDDLEADLGASIRSVIGESIPLLTTLDLHGSITEEMNEVYDYLLGVYEYPHVDMYERGVEAIEAVPRLASGEWRPETVVERLPLLIPTSTTDRGVAAELRDRCLAATNEPGVLRAAFFHGFPYTDIPQAGSSIVVSTNGDPELARAVAQRLAAEVWQRREEFRGESLTPELALRRAMDLVAVKGGPVVVNDTADNPGGGTPGDATHVLRALVEANPARACFATIFDPMVAQQAHEAGPSSVIRVSLGGKH